MEVFVILALVAIVILAVAALVDQNDTHRIEDTKEFKTYSNRFH